MIKLFTTNISDQAVSNVSSVLSSSMLSEGKLVAKFEDKISHDMGLKNPVALNSGTSALHLSLVLAKVRPGDEVILPAQTFIATGLAVLYTGATPIFVDIDYKTGNIDVESIRRNITSKTRAIIVVHWGGLPCDMDEIISIAKYHSIPVIEDAAHALGAEYKGRQIGSISEYTCFSFQAIKHVSTGDGGAIAFKSKESSDHAKSLRWFGIDRKNTAISLLGERDYDISEVGYKYHMNDYSAALGVANLEGYKDRLKWLREINYKYRNEFSSIDGVSLMLSPDDRRSACWLFGMHVQQRDDFIKALASRGVAASVIHQRIDRNKVFGGLTKDLVSQELFDETQIHIPIHSGLTGDQVEKVISSVKQGW
jgi:perosamine synthetase